VTLTMTCQWYMPLSRIGQVIMQLFKMPMQVVVGLAVRFSVQQPGPRFSRPQSGRAGGAACCLPSSGSFSLGAHHPACRLPVPLHSQCLRGLGVC
jgi:hypothetical protein